MEESTNIHVWCLLLDIDFNITDEYRQDLICVTRALQTFSRDVFEHLGHSLDLAYDDVIRESQRFNNIAKAAVWSHDAPPLHGPPAIFHFPNHSITIKQNATHATAEGLQRSNSCAALQAANDSSFVLFCPQRILELNTLCAISTICIKYDVEYAQGMLRILLSLAALRPCPLLDTYLTRKLLTSLLLILAPHLLLPTAAGDPCARQKQLCLLFHEILQFHFPTIALHLDQHFYTSYWNSDWFDSLCSNRFVSSLAWLQFIFFILQFYRCQRSPYLSYSRPSQFCSSECKSSVGGSLTKFDAALDVNLPQRIEVPDCIDYENLSKPKPKVQTRTSATHNTREQFNLDVIRRHGYTELFICILSLMRLQRKQQVLYCSTDSNEIDRALAQQLCTSFLAGESMNMSTNQILRGWNHIDFECIESDKSHKVMSNNDFAPNQSRNISQLSLPDMFESVHKIMLSTPNFWLDTLNATVSSWSFVAQSCNEAECNPFIHTNSLTASINSTNRGEQNLGTNSIIKEPDLIQELASHCGLTATPSQIYQMLSIHPNAPAATLKEEGNYHKANGGLEITSNTTCGILISDPSCQLKKSGSLNSQLAEDYADLGIGNQKESITTEYHESSAACRTDDTSTTTMTSIFSFNESFSESLVNETCRSSTTQHELEKADEFDAEAEERLRSGVSALSLDLEIPTCEKTNVQNSTGKSVPASSSNSYIQIEQTNIEASIDDKDAINAWNSTCPSDINSSFAASKSASTPMSGGRSIPSNSSDLHQVSAADKFPASEKSPRAKGLEGRDASGTSHEFMFFEKFQTILAEYQILQKKKNRLNQKVYFLIPYIPDIDKKAAGRVPISPNEDFLLTKNVQSLQNVCDSVCVIPVQLDKLTHSPQSTLFADLRMQISASNPGSNMSLQNINASDFKGFEGINRSDAVAEPLMVVCNPSKKVEIQPSPKESLITKKKDLILDGVFQKPPTLSDSSDHELVVALFYQLVRMGVPNVILCPQLYLPLPSMARQIPSRNDLSKSCRRRRPTRPFRFAIRSASSRGTRRKLPVNEALQSNTKSKNTRPHSHVSDQRSDTKAMSFSATNRTQARPFFVRTVHHKRNQETSGNQQGEMQTRQLPSAAPDVPSKSAWSWLLPFLSSTKGDKKGGQFAESLDHAATSERAVKSVCGGNAKFLPQFSPGDIPILSKSISTGKYMRRGTGQQSSTIYWKRARIKKKIANSSVPLLTDSCASVGPLTCKLPTSHSLVNNPSKIRSPSENLDRIVYRSLNLASPRLSELTSINNSPIAFPFQLKSQSSTATSSTPAPTPPEWKATLQSSRVPKFGVDYQAYHRMKESQHKQLQEKKLLTSLRSINNPNFAMSGKAHLPRG